MTKVQVFSNGSVYSPADPFATSLVANGEKVEWVGSDAGAESIMDDSMESQDLNGLLITPGFVVGGVTVDSLQELQNLEEQLPAHGYVAGTIFIGEDLLKEASKISGLSLYPYVRIQRESKVEHLKNLGAYGVLVDAGQTEASVLVSKAVDAGLKVAFDASSEDLIESALAIIEALNAENPLKRLRAGFRLDGVLAVSQAQLNRIEKLNISIGFVDDLNATYASLVSAIKAGVATYIGSSTQPTQKLWGWELTTLAVYRQNSSDNISARAAFNSQTRGAWRGLGFVEPTQGQLVPGGNADFALWHFDSLMVQTADERVAAWSTDPRARTPLLPALDGDTYPQCAATYRSSAPIFERK